MYNPMSYSYNNIPNQMQPGFFKNMNAYNPNPMMYNQNSGFNYNGNYDYSNADNFNEYQINKRGFNTKNEISMIIPNQKKHDSLNELLKN